MFLPDLAHARLATQIGECSWNRTMLNMGGAAPFQIDGSLGAPAALAESLLQSHENVLPTEEGLRAAYTGDAGKVPLIRLLPSLPTAWAASGGGWVKGLRARGGFTVDLSWDSVGRLTTASLRSEGGNSAYVTLGQARVASLKTAVKATTIQVDNVTSGVFVRLDGGKGSVFNVTLAI